MLGAPFGRPTFWRRVGLSFLPLGAGLSLWPLHGFADAPAPNAPELIRRRIFYENPEYRDVKISSDGKHLSSLAPFDRVRNLCVASIDATHDAKPRTHPIEGEIGWEYRWAFANRHIVFFRDHDADENWRASRVDIEDGAIVALSPESGVKDTALCGRRTGSTSPLSGPGAAGRRRLRRLVDPDRDRPGARAGVAGLMGISVAPHPNPLPARGERGSVMVPRPVYGERVTIAQRWTNEGQQPVRTGRPEHL